MSSSEERVVLVVTGQDDVQSDMLITELEGRGVGVLRLHPGDDQPIDLDADLIGGRWCGQVGQYERAARLEQVTGVVWRWVQDPPGDPAIDDPALREWAAFQDQAAVFGVLQALTGVAWVNHPAAQLACSKAAQLLAASALGFATPQTLITRTGETAAAWAAAGLAGGELLTKPFFGGLGPTERVPARLAADLPAGDLFTAAMFQPVIRGREIRASVVADEVHAVDIIPADPDTIDWRPDQDTATIRPVRLPTHVQDGLRAMLRRFGLGYGAFDLIVDAGGEHWLLEVNVRGAWGAYEPYDTHPITAALADYLAPARIATTRR